MDWGYGFIGNEHLAAERVVTIGEDVVADMIYKTAAEYSVQLYALLANFAKRTTKWRERIKLPFGGELQPLDAKGNPLPAFGGGSYTAAYPIDGAGDAFGNDRVSRYQMTLQEANELTISMIGKDARWTRSRMLAALLVHTNRTFEDTINGPLVCLPLANGDDVVYLKCGGSTSTANHYLAQADAISDAHDGIETMHNTLHAYPSQKGYGTVVYLASDLVAGVRGLAGFVPIRDTQIVPGSSATTLAGGVPPNVLGPGDEVIGKIDNGPWVVDWSTGLPSGYALGKSLAPDATPLALREYPQTELQGFIPESHSPDGGLIERRFVRFMGFGVQNRIGAVVLKVGAAEYAVPTNWTNPTSIII